MSNINSNLVRYDNDGIELIIDTKTGESFATAKGYSRMSTIEYDTIKKRCQRGGLGKSEIPTSQGFVWGTLVNEDLICEWLPKDNPKMATQLLKLGVRSFLHKLAGFEVRSTAIADYQIPQTLSQALFEAAKQAERAELAEAENKQLQAKIEADKPKVALAEAIAFSDDSIDFNSYAKIINTGRTRLFRAMRDCGVIMKNSTLPYQECDTIKVFMFDMAA